MCKPKEKKKPNPNLNEVEQMLLVLKSSYLKQFPHLNAA